MTDIEFFNLLGNECVAEILALVKARPGINSKNICNELCYFSQPNRFLNRMVDAGVLTRKKVRTENWHWISPDFVLNIRARLENQGVLCGADTGRN